MQPKWNGMKALITYKEIHERRAPYKLRCSRQSHSQITSCRRCVALPDGVLSHTCVVALRDRGGFP